MAIVRWDPFRELEEMSDRLNRMISRPSTSPVAGQGKEVMTVADWFVRMGHAHGITLRDGTPVITRQAKPDFIDDRGAKPVAINRIIGRRPILAVGNSDGDVEERALAGGQVMRDGRLEQVRREPPALHARNVERSAA